MAKPIKNTPVLTGRDAINFHEVLAKNKNTRVDVDKVLHIRELAKKLRDRLVPKQ